MLEISAAGLKRRARQRCRRHERGRLPQSAARLVDRGYTRAEELLDRYHGEWKGDLTPLFKEYNFL